MKLAVGRPDAVWTRWVGTTMDAARTSHAIVITLEVASTWIAEGSLGRKTSRARGMSSCRVDVTGNTALCCVDGCAFDRQGRQYGSARGIGAKRTPVAGQRDRCTGRAVRMPTCHWFAARGDDIAGMARIAMQELCSSRREASRRT
jgi:hypothetical protein